MGHRCCSKQKVKRGLWSPEEDEKLVKCITTHGHGSWSSVPKLAGLQRCGKSCRLRWINYLRPDVKRGTFSEEEERTIIEVHRIVGNRWAQIAKHLPGRTDNEVKNFWNSCIKKKLLAQGLDPNTHNLLPHHNKITKNNTSSHQSRKHAPVFSTTMDMVMNIGELSPVPLDHDHSSNGLVHLPSIQQGSSSAMINYTTTEHQTSNMLAADHFSSMGMPGDFSSCSLDPVSAAAAFGGLVDEDFMLENIFGEEVQKLLQMDGSALTSSYDLDYCGIGNYSTASMVNGDVDCIDKVAWGC
ncbi:hypothetical protein Ancab_019153 [Ancistrocladus abbreviatus]